MTKKTADEIPEWVDNLIKTGVGLLFNAVDKIATNVVHPEDPPEDVYPREVYPHRHGPVFETTTASWQVWEYNGMFAVALADEDLADKNPAMIFWYENFEREIDEAAERAAEAQNDRNMWIKADTIVKMT